MVRMFTSDLFAYLRPFSSTGCRSRIPCRVSSLSTRFPVGVSPLCMGAVFFSLSRYSSGFSPVVAFLLFFSFWFLVFSCSLCWSCFCFLDASRSGRGVCLRRSFSFSSLFGSGALCSLGVARWAWSRLCSSQLTFVLPCEGELFSAARYSRPPPPLRCQPPAGGPGSVAAGKLTSLHPGSGLMLFVFHMQGPCGSGHSQG